MKTSPRMRQSGFSLVELMIASLLGLLLLLGAASAFIASSKTIDSSRSLGQIQENSRAAFELMSRDAREAGGNPCSNDLTYSNVLNTRTNTWWSEWTNGARGYAGSQATPGTPTGTGNRQRVAGTEAFDVHSAFEGSASLVTAMASTTATMAVDDATGLGPGVLAIVCDTSEAYIFQITSAAGATNVAHAAGSGSPGNCTGGFMPPTTPCATSGVGYVFGTDASLTPLGSTRWYVGFNDEGTRSLFRARMINRGSSTTPTEITPVEIARGVESMTITYRAAGSDNFVDPAAITNWSQVRSMRVALNFAADLPNQRDVNATRLERTTTTIISMRNR
jgi:type IV pilus assembly protein PilW